MYTLLIFFFSSRYRQVLRLTDDQVSYRITLSTQAAQIRAEFSKETRVLLTLTLQAKIQKPIHHSPNVPSRMQCEHASSLW